MNKQSAIPPNTTATAMRLFLSVRHIIAVTLFFVCCCGSAAYGAVPLRFDVFEPRVLETPQGLVLGLSCSVDDEDALRSLLKDGAVLNLSTEVTIEGHRSWWLNRSVEKQTFISAIRHNPLTREYSVTLPQGASPQTLKDRNLTRLLYASWRKLSFVLLPPDVVQGLDKDREYTVTVSIDLQHAEVPPWLENSLGIWSSEIIPQQTKRITLTFPVTSAMP